MGKNDTSRTALGFWLHGVPKKWPVEIVIFDGEKKTKKGAFSTRCL
jgi:hypothetical protein